MAQAWLIRVNPELAVALTRAGDADEHTRYRYILMPMRICCRSVRTTTTTTTTAEVREMVLYFFAYRFVHAGLANRGPLTERAF